MSEGMADMPEELNVDTESDGAGLGDYEDFSDGDHDKDEDYNDTQAPIQRKSKMYLKKKRLLRLLVNGKKGDRNKSEFEFKLL